MTIGVILVNLGTPDDKNIKSVRSYLREFLSDPRVLDVPFFVRWILLYFFILPFRPKKSLEAYKKVWLKNGSPLRVFGDSLAQKVQEELGDEYKVVLAMRYGSPSIKNALNKMADCSEIRVLPLFPQYASATTGSVIEKIFTELGKEQYIPSINILPEFYHNDNFISAYVDTINNNIDINNTDKLIFSFHGLPVRHIVKSGCEYVCGKESCPNISTKNKACYRAQCYATARSIAAKLGVTQEKYEVSFQSRLGRTPWIEPYTDTLLEELSQNKTVKNIAVSCPAFVADCLETIEEIGMEARQQWLDLGGEQFTLIPCINDSSMWVDAVVDMVK
jgi:ferrochelatase